MAISNKDLIKSLHQLDDVTDKQHKSNIRIGKAVDSAVKDYNNNVEEMEETKRSYDSAAALQALLDDGSSAIMKSQTALNNTMQRMEDHHMQISNMVKQTHSQMDKAQQQSLNFQKDVVEILFDAKKRMRKIIARDTAFYIESMPSFKLYSFVKRNVDKYNVPVNRLTGALSNILFGTLGYHAGKNL